MAWLLAVVSMTACTYAAYLVQGFKLGISAVMCVPETSSGPVSIVFHLLMQSHN